MKTEKDIELLEELTCFNIDGTEIDLHNEYKCIELEFDYQLKELKFLFKSIDQLNDKIAIKFVFHEVVIMKFKSIFTKSDDSGTIMTLHRGRFMVDNFLYDISDQLGMYFYLEFYEDDEFEFFSKGLAITKLEL